MNNEHFTLSSMQNYSSPKYPTRADKPIAVQKLPACWAKNTAILACIGALSLGALAGCSPQASIPLTPPASCYDGNHGVAAVRPHAEGERSFDVVVRTHFGGSGAGPFYVAYLTEQEALGIIRNRLCEAGICFDAPRPGYVATVEVARVEATARLALFDERTRQGIVFPARWWSPFIYWPMSHEEVEDALREYFSQNFNISATFIRNPSRSIGAYDWDGSPDFDWEFEPEFTDEAKQELAPKLKQALLNRVDAFIDQLRIDGILPADGAES